MIYRWQQQQQQDNNNNVFISRNIKFTILCPASSYNANLGRTRLYIKTLLNYTRKKKRKEIQKRTERNTLHINSLTGDFVIWKGLKLQVEKKIVKKIKQKKKTSKENKTIIQPKE